MTGNNNNFKMKSAEWQGYLKATLETMKKDMDEIKEGMETLNERMTKIRVKVASIGASVSLLTTLLIFLIKELLAK